MEFAIRSVDAVQSGRRPVVVALLAVVGLSFQPAFAQPLNLFRDFIVTGDYAVGGVGLRGLGQNGFATGTIRIPDPNQPNANSVPAGADIVAAYLYWETVEKSGTFVGQRGFFNGYGITGTILGNPNAPTSWSTGGCSGSSQGAKTMVAYRADVRPYLPRDTDPTSSTFGQVQGNGSFAVKLADSGSNGGGVPLTLGASLVVVYRVLSPAAALNAVVILDGSFAPSNATSSLVLTMPGIYQAATSPVAKVTHIVGNGQPNKLEQVFLNNVALPSLYPNLPPFPGIYNGSWDNPTWSPAGAVAAGASAAQTSVVPSATNSGCVTWGVVVFSSTVQNSDNDGLLDIWKINQGYTDAISGNWIALPGANRTPGNPSVRDIFVEVDYLSNLDLKASNYAHSHLPKKDALDMVGSAFGNQGIHLHFDLGPGIYPGDPYVIQYPNPVPPGTIIGGNSISESAVVCNDSGAALCGFPSTPAVSWKGGLTHVQNSAALGNFQSGRGISYHYLLSGHAMGAPRSLWTTFATAASPPPVRLLPQLVSIVNNGTTATVTLRSPAGLLKPGDPVNSGDPAFGDANLDRVTITGAMQGGLITVNGVPQQAPSALNGTYKFTNLSSTLLNNGNTQTTFTITTANVANGTYNFSNEPEMTLAFAGPRSASGHSDIGGGDSAIALGLWPADDLAGCQPDPSQPPTAAGYCNNQMGTVQAQAGTFIHEFGHTLGLTHGATYYQHALNSPPSKPTYGLNCESNFLSMMNYQFQIRGFPEGPGVDFSGQALQPLDETMLNEFSGIGPVTVPHYTRWYAPPNALDTKLQNTVGGRYATKHCDGTPLLPGEMMVRVDGTTFGSPIDWNNDLTIEAGIYKQDSNFNGITGDPPFQGSNDWMPFDLLSGLHQIGVELRQIGARRNAFALSGSGDDLSGSGDDLSGSGDDLSGSGDDLSGSGDDLSGSGDDLSGSGAEIDLETVNSTADPPRGLTAIPYPLNTHEVQLSWTAPASIGQVRTYYIWRATGSFPTPASIIANYTQFTNIGSVAGTPPATAFIDKNVKNKTTDTYFVTDGNRQKVQSGPSTPATIAVSF